MKKRIRFIINPVSGISNKARLQEIIDQRIDKAKFDTEIVSTEYGGHARELAAHAVAQDYDAVVVAGGDGTVNEVASALANTSLPLGIIPLGSGNGLAHHLKLPFNLNRALQSISRLQTRSIDTYMVNGKFGCNLAGVGFDAHVAEKFAKVKRRGFWSYFKIVVREYPVYKPIQYQFTLQGNTFTRKALLVSFANSDQFGNGVAIAPEAKIDDGLLHVCILSKVPWVEAPVLGQVMMLRLINRTHYVDYIKTSEIILEQPASLPYHIDGDPAGFSRELHVKVNPLSLNVIVP